MQRGGIREFEVEGKGCASAPRIAAQDLHPGGPAFSHEAEGGIVIANDVKQSRTLAEPAAHGSPRPSASRWRSAHPGSPRSSTQKRCQEQRWNAKRARRGPCRIARHPRWRCGYMCAH